MTEKGFSLNVHITGLCILAHQPNYVHVVMPPTPVEGDPGVPRHFAKVWYDGLYSPTEKPGEESLDGRYLVIRGDENDTLCPSISKGVVDLTDTFNVKLPGYVVIPKPDTRGPKTVRSTAAALVRIETGQAAANTPGNLFRVEGDKPARHLSWHLTWTTHVTAETWTLQMISMSDSTQHKDVVLHPHENKIEITILNTPHMDGDMTEPPKFEQIHHFMAYYNLLGINEPVPTYYGKVPSSDGPHAARGLPDVHILNNAYTCIPTSCQIG